MKRKFTYANVMSTLAAFLALTTGSAFAAKVMIDGNTIKRNSIPATAIKNGTIDSADLKNGSVTAADLKAGSLPASVLSTAAIEQIAAAGKPESTPASERVVGQPCVLLTLGGRGVWQVATSLDAAVYAGKVVCIVRGADGAYVTGSDEAVNA